MMKKILFTISLLTGVAGFSQSTEVSVSSQNELTPKLPSTSARISYAKQLPAIDSYQIEKNTSGSAISEEVLKMVNYHRRLEDYLWVVNNDIEILVLKFNK